jgi:hypothetical protein
MVPPLLETPHDDTEFDLDVRLQAVARDVSDESRPRATQYTNCHANCTGGQFTCNCHGK